MKVCFQRQTEQKMKLIKAFSTVDHTIAKLADSGMRGVAIKSIAIMRI